MPRLGLRRRRWEDPVEDVSQDVRGLCCETAVSLPNGLHVTWAWTPGEMWVRAPTEKDLQKQGS